MIGRLVGQHPDGGPVTVRDGRYGAYVNWGRVNATIPKGTAPDSVASRSGSGADRRTRGQAGGSAAKGGRRVGEDQGSIPEAQGGPAICEGRTPKGDRQERLPASREAGANEEAAAVERQGQEFGDPLAPAARDALILTL